MKKDRLRHDRDEVKTLDDLIDARKGRLSHFSQDMDAFEEDVELSDDIDVDGALTFPHPKHKKSEVEDIELMDTPDEENLDDDQDAWADQEFLPEDYAHHYDEAQSTYATDNEDEIVEDQKRDLSYVRVDEISDEPTTEQMPSKFTPDKITEAIEDKTTEKKPDKAGKIMADERTREETQEMIRELRKENRV